MNAVKKIPFRVAQAIAALALLIGIASVNATCYCWFHQPIVPEGMKEFKK